MRSVHGNTRCDSTQRDDQGVLSTPEVQGKGIKGSDRGMVAKVDNDPKPTDQDRPAMDNKMSGLSCTQNVLDEFPFGSAIPSKVVSPQSLVLFDRAQNIRPTRRQKENEFPSLCLKKSRGLGLAPRSTDGTISMQRKSQIYNFCDSAIAKD